LAIFTSPNDKSCFIFSDVLAAGLLIIAAISALFSNPIVAQNLIEKENKIRI
jgi:hypothetical protein